MAKSQENAGSATSKNARTQRTNIPWVTANYDDETTLIAIRSAHPGAKWKEIRELFNSCVPEKRRRTPNAIYSKAKVICSAYDSNKDSRMTGTAGSALANNSADVPYGNSILFPSTPPTTCMEILSSSWDGFTDSEAYASFMTEMEALEWASIMEESAS